MQFTEQWQEIGAFLPEGWTSAQLSLSVAEDADPDRAALILASLNPGRTASSFRLDVTPWRSPESILRRLDDEGIRGRIDLVDSEVRAAEPAPARPVHLHQLLASQWAGITADLPPDWSDVYAEIELASSDFIARAALLLAPVNPARYGGPTVFRFRSARRAGYGTAPEMVQRCMERLDAERITGSLRTVRALSDTHHAFTQGPVWRVEGRSV